MPMVSRPAGAASDEVPRVVAVPPAWRLVVLVTALVCGVIVVRNVVGEAHRVIGWAVAASVVAFLIAPVVQHLDRYVPRAVAIVLSFATVVVLGGALTWLYSSSVLDQVAQIQESGPSIAEEIEARGDRLGEIAREIGLVEQVTELTDRLGQETGSRGEAIKSIALSAPAYFVSMILAIFLLLFGPRIVQGGLDQLSEQRRARWRPALDGSSARTQLYVWASIGQGGVNALAIWTVGSVLGVPAVALLAIVGGVLALVPYLGIIVGWIPVLLLGLGVAPEWQLALAALVGIGLQLVEVLLWRPLIDRRSLHVGPAIPVIVAIVGFGVYGVGGALYGCALAVFGLALVDQLSPGDRDLPTPLDEPVASSDPVGEEPA